MNLTVQEDRFPQLVLMSTLTLRNFLGSLRLFSGADGKTHLEIWNGEHEAGGQVGFGNGALEFLHTGNTGLVQRDRNQPQVCHDSFPVLHMETFSQNLPTRTGLGKKDCDRANKP